MPIEQEPQTARSSQAHAIVTLLLIRLDTAYDSVDALARAFLAGDAERALMVRASLRRTWSDAYSLILVLEGLSGVSEVNAWDAYDASQRIARIPLLLASSLISRLSAKANPPLRDLRLAYGS